MVTGVGWTPSNDLYSVSDDKSIWKWGLDGEPEQRLIENIGDTFVTDMKWLTSIRGGNVTAEVFVVGCSDGTFRIYNNLGRLDKTEKAHKSDESKMRSTHLAQNNARNPHSFCVLLFVFVSPFPSLSSGAIISLAWNSDGTSLLTAGEDGTIKQYSRTGNLRSKLVQADNPIYCVTWSPDQQSILYCTGRYVVIKPLQVSAKIVKWKAHEGTVLKVDWNPITNLIVTGGEDRRYKVWDSYGQLLFSSKPSEFSITSVAWSPNGEYFAVGSFNTITLCDKTGWTHSRSRTNSGSILSLDWTGDGTHLAGAGANGAVVFGQVIDRTLEWKNYEIRLDQGNHIHILDVLTLDTSTSSGSSSLTSGPQPTEELEFGHRVIEMSMGFDFLIVATTKQCYIYHISNFSTPHIFDLSGGTVSLILQSSKYFLLVDKIRGLQVYSYEGRQISTPKLPGGVLNPAFLKKGNISMSNDIIAVIDRVDSTQIHLIDLISGKALAGTPPIKHEIEIMEVSLSMVQLGNVASGNERKLFFIDRNRDLWLYNTARTGSSYKLATMVDSAIWNEDTDILAALSDSRLVFWYYPAVVYVDKDLVAWTKSSGLSDDTSVIGGAASGIGSGITTNFGKSAHLTSFVDNRLRIRRADGSILSTSMSPYPSLLYSFARDNSWIRCTRLCRSVRDDKTLWAMLAVMAIQAAQLDTAEIALASIELIDKLQYIQSVKMIPSQEGRNAELALYKRQIKQAEDILLNADLIYRAIKMNIGLFKWGRALELAVKYKTHIDTVLAYRSKYLESLNQKDETDDKFLKLKDSVPIDWSAINSKIEAEMRKEEARGTPYRSIFPQLNDEDPLANLAKQTEKRHNDGDGL